jgi:hypothetical protein
MFLTVTDVVMVIAVEVVDGLEWDWVGDSNWG